MRAQESTDPCKHLSLILPGGPTSGEHARGPLEYRRKREEVGGGGEERRGRWGGEGGREGGREVAGSQRETERAAIARGQAHRGRSKSGARPRGRPK